MIRYANDQKLLIKLVRYFKCYICGRYFTCFMCFDRNDFCKYTLTVSHDCYCDKCLKFRGYERHNHDTKEISIEEIVALEL